MLGEILSVRFLNCSIPTRGFTAMTTIPATNPGLSAFQRIFPFKLKYFTLSGRFGALSMRSEGVGVRRFSNGSFRARNGGGRSGGGRNSEFSGVRRGGEARNSEYSGVRRGGGGRNTEFSGGRRGGEERNSEYSGVRRGGGARNLEYSGVRRGGEARNLENSGVRRGGGGRNTEFSGGRRGGEERNSEFSEVRRGGQAKSLIDDEDEISDWISGLKTDKIRVRLSSDDDNGDMDGDMDREKGRGRERDSGFVSKNQKDRRDEFSGSKRRFRESDSDDFSVSNRRSARGLSGSFAKSSQGNSSRPVSKRQFVSETKDDGDDDIVLSPRRREHGSRGALSSTSKTSRRDSESSYGGSAGTKSSKKKRFLSSDMEDDVVDDDDGDEEDSFSGFGDLLEETDSEEDELEDPQLSGAGMSVKEAVVEKDRATVRTKSSAGESDSYLSQTRILNLFLFKNDLHLKDIEKSQMEIVVSINKGTALRVVVVWFDQCTVSPLSLKGIKDAGYEKMTLVQEATLPVILKGKDVLAKAKTGTGKTVAFLLPAIEVVVKLPPVDRDSKRPPIVVLVICPTRELACQAAAEADKLLKYHPSIGVQVVIGGVRLALEQKRMQANPCQILVATPGRLRDHIENTAGFATRLMGVKMLVLDEADHLLDMGFRKEIERIIAAVPKQRQTLLFSATVPEEVRQICHIALKRDHEFINTVEEGSEETHSQVRQTQLVAPLDMHFSLLYVLLKEHISDDVDYKVLVFCTTAMVTRLIAGLLSELNLNVREIHSRKPQSYRTRVSDEFRKSKGLILATSDVSARGVDYPDVTMVIQIGLPADREQYIHRLGRTGRKGKEGQGILLLAPWEEFFLSNIRDLPISKASAPSVDPEIKKKVERALSQVEMKNKEAAYQAWLGYYNSNKTVGKDKYRLVELANDFSRSMGLANPPAIPKLVLGKMGLRNVPGLRSK
ncbi:hypothetical protein Scep_025671 [Stephania cephalantha]|uniref:ATP-dependent RNA helicase n=1 Tax=Stephania cephalantha TaxID=152367 RepID=A0AAP0ENW6_9MAGN